MSLWNIFRLDYEFGLLTFQIITDWLRLGFKVSDCTPNKKFFLQLPTINLVMEWKLSSQGIIQNRNHEDPTVRSPKKWSRSFYGLWLTRLVARRPTLQLLSSMFCSLRFRWGSAYTTLTPGSSLNGNCRGVDERERIREKKRKRKGRERERERLRKRIPIGKERGLSWLGAFSFFFF